MLNKKENLYFFNKNNIPSVFDIPDIYFLVDYGKACEYSDNAHCEYSIPNILFILNSAIEMNIHHQE